MHAETIRTALGQLQEDPDTTQPWEALAASLQAEDRAESAEELLPLLHAARHKHVERGESDAVARLLALEIHLARGSDAEVPLLRERARVLRDELLDDEGAAAELERLLERAPGDSSATEALEDARSKRSKWRELVTTYTAEAEQAPDDVYKSSMLMRASEMELRFAGPDADPDGVLGRLEQAVRLDPTNVRAGRILEHVYRRAERWQDVASALERMADRGESPVDRFAARVRLARVWRHRLQDEARASRAYDLLQRERPDFPEAMAFLAEFYERAERWDDLVGLYERDLASKGHSSAERLGDMLQIAMLFWKKAARPKEAEVWFDRIAKVEPLHPGMIAFYREHAVELGQEGRLIEILTNAQRAMKDGPEKSQISAEIARLAEGQANAQKAIEQYKGILRQDPDNAEARDALKRLYRQTQGYNALVELLRQHLERVGADDYETRLRILREVATVYRQFIKSDTALVSVLNQIVQLDEKLDENDVDEVRELVGLYEKLGRWRDLLTNQLRLAEITSDTEEKKDLYRAAARRWLEQFSNVQNATEAYESLLALEPTDREARERLHELYRKRRAWPSLFELFEKELASAQGTAQVPLLQEMAQLAAERLGKPAEAVALYRRILELDPSRSEVLDALERHAERSRDFATLADVLERRVDLAVDDEARLASLVRLGGVYADQLKDAERATSAWRRVLELSPGHHRALRVLREAYLETGDYDGLEQLYGSQDDWEGLAEVLSNAADRAKDDASKVELSNRAARVYEDQLNQPDRAFRSYERILATQPSNVAAAQKLIPLYERDDKWARLPALYELVASQSDADAQVEVYKKIVDITANRLSDRKAAAAYARKAYEIAPARADVLASFEQASRDAGAFEPFVQALEGRLASLDDAPSAVDDGASKKKKKGKKKGEAPTAGSGESSEERRGLELLLARVYTDDLGRSDDAVSVYKRLLERTPSDAEAASLLEVLLRRSDQRDDLRWLLDLQISHQEDVAERARRLAEWAALEEDVFQDPERAIALHRRVLELDPDHLPTLAALSRLLLALGDASAAATVIEHHRDLLTGEERAVREAQLAQLYLARQEDHSRALDAAVRALELMPAHGPAVTVLEKLMEDPAMRARAAEVLAEQYAAGGEARREAEALAVMLAQATDAEERRALITRLADVHEDKLDSHASALDVLLRGVREFPADLSFWERANSLSVLASRPTELAEAFREVLASPLDAELEAELCERAARFHEERLGDPIGATPYLERVLERQPGNEQAFSRLKDILTAAERWTELESLYDKATAATEDVSRRIEMLVEVALICEEIIEDAAKATAYYERIVELDSLHEASIRALDRLYAQQERFADLAVLIERRLEAAAGDDLLELKLRLSRLFLERLHQPEKAALHVEDVLRERINDYEGRELAERMLDIGSLRNQAARMLEAVYEARNETRDLVRVLAIRLTELDKEAAAKGETELSDDRRDILRRIAAASDERLHDDEGALDALARLVPSDPLDSDARARLLDIGRRLGAHARVAQVLTESAARADTPGLQGEVLMQVARLYEDQLNSPAQAEETYRRVLSLDETDADLVLPAARALERNYVASSKPRELAEVLRVQVKLEQDGDTRKQLLGRLGELCQSVLDDVPGAIEAWRMRAEEVAADEEALAALDALYEKSEQWRELVETLARRREATEDQNQRRQLLVRTAEVLSARLDNVSEAIDAWRAVIDEYGPDDESLRALEGLLARAEEWQELGDTYERHLELVESDADRLTLLSKLGELRSEHLHDLEGALEVYRRSLTLEPSHAPSRQALERMLGLEDRPAKREAAEILHPIYEADGEHERLLRVVEIEVETSEDLDEKLESLQKAITIAEDALSDASRAFVHAEAGVRAAAGHADLAPWLAHVERLANKTERQADFVKLLCQVAPDIFDGDIQLDVLLKIADTARHRLADRELAREYYQKGLELRPDDSRALTALESLYEEAGDAPHLLEILERRADVVESEAEKKQLMFRRARLLSDVLEDNARAIEVYQNVLDLGLERDAIDALESLFTLEERWADLVELYERQVDAGPSDVAELRVKMAQVLAHRLGDMARAFDELEAALEQDRNHSAAIAELEKLLEKAPEPEHRARAAAMLEPVYLTRADFDRVMAAISARLDFEQEPEQRRELLSRLAQLYEEQKEDYVAALETTAKLLAEDASSKETLAELERLAKVAGAEKRLAEIYADRLGDGVLDDEDTARLARRTGELFAQLGDLDRALGFYRRALAFEPESRELFDAADDILRRTNRHEERVEHYRKGLDHRYEPAERLAALHTIAELLRGELGRPEEAIEVYRSALEVEERDPRALDALTELYRAAARHSDLAEHYSMRAELAEAPSDAAAHRLELARLLRDQLGDHDRAIDQLEEIVRSVPANADAIKELENLLDDERFKERVVEILRPLYEGADDWRRLIKLNEERYALAEVPSERVQVLRETAELWEQRGGDLERARRALGAAFGIDPDDADVRAELERLVQATGQWDSLATAFTNALQSHPGLASEREILARLAEVHDRHRDDPRAALAAYARLREIDESDPAPLAKMEELATLLSDWTVLVKVLHAKAEIALEDEERASLWRRVAEAKRDMLEDPAGAMEAYERALEFEPDSAFTVDCLIALREEHGEPEALAELLQRRVELTTDSEDADLRYELLVQAAKVHEQKLSDRGRAIEALVQALAARPDDATVIAELGRLYRAEQLWPELLENLRLVASRATDVTERATIRREIGDILAAQLSAWDDALEAYRLVLEDVPTDTAATEQVLIIGREHEDLRDAVAEVLVPALQRAENWAALVEVLELRLSIETEPTTRAATLVRIAEVQESQLSNHEQALGAVLRALAERPDADDIHQLAEKLAASSRGFGRYADTLAERAGSTFDPDVAKELFFRLGRIAEERLEDPARAIEAYSRAIEQAGDQPELLAALDRLYLSTRDFSALADILERRAIAETSEADQADLHHRLGELQAREFNEPSRALASFRSAIERKADHEGAIEELEKLTSIRDLFEEVVEILEGVYRARGATDRLARLYEKRVGFAESPAERIDMRKSLAKVLENDCSDAQSAQRVLQQGLSDDPSDAALVDEIERLAQLTGNWEGAAAALRSALEERSELPAETARDLAVRLATWQRDKIEDPAAAEGSLLKALGFDPGNDEVLVLLESIQRAPGRARDLVSTLRKRAAISLDEQRREDFYREAKQLADDLNDQALAEEVLRELIGHDDTNLWALGQLTELRRAAGDWQETFALLVRRSDVRADGGVLKDLRHQAARIAREQLAKPGAAIDLYQQLFEDDPDDKDASSALRELYAAESRWDELSRLIERLVELTDRPEERTALRIALARLQVEQFKATDSAIESLKTVLEESPGENDAVVLLSELYESTQRDEELAELLSEQITRARERADLDAELTFQVRLGEIFESRLNDREKAVQTYRAVLERSPEHRGALGSLARLLAALGQHSDSGDVLEKLLAMSEGEEALRLALELADTRQGAGDAAGVVRALERGLDVDRRSGDLRTRLAALYEKAGDFDKLAEFVTEDATLAEDAAIQVTLLRKAAAIHTRSRKDPSRAAEVLQRALELRSDDRELMLELCDALSASGRGKEAAEVLEKIVESYGGKRSKELGEIHRRLADAYLADGQTERALEELDKAFRIEPGNISVLHKLGTVALAAGDMKKAQQMFRALLLQKLEADSPITKAEVFLHLGEVHEGLGEKSKAVQMYERAVQSDDNLARAKEKLAALKGS